MSIAVTTSALDPVLVTAVASNVLNVLALALPLILEKPRSSSPWIFSCISSFILEALFEVVRRFSSNFSTSLSERSWPRRADGIRSLSRCKDERPRRGTCYGLLHHSTDKVKPTAGRVPIGRS